MKAFDQRIGARCQLQGEPQMLLLDPDMKVLYVDVVDGEDTGKIAEIDLVTNQITYQTIASGKDIIDMENGPDNSLLVKTADDLYLFDKVSKNVLSSWPLEGERIVFNGSRSEIISNDSSRLIRYGFSLSEGVELLQEKHYSGCSDLDLSPDNLHLTYGNAYWLDTGITLYDIDPSDLNNHVGSWTMMKDYPSLTAFNWTSDTLFTLSRLGISVYSREDYSFNDSLDASFNLEPGGLEVSLGNRICFAFSDDVNLREPILHWLIYQ